MIYIMYSQCEGPKFINWMWKYLRGPARCEKDSSWNLEARTVSVLMRFIQAWCTHFRLLEERPISCWSSPARCGHIVYSAIAFVASKRHQYWSDTYEPTSEKLRSGQVKRKYHVLIAAQDLIAMVWPCCGKLEIEVVVRNSDVRVIMWAIVLCYRIYFCILTYRSSWFSIEGEVGRSVTFGK